MATPRSCQAALPTQRHSHASHRSGCCTRRRSKPRHPSAHPQVTLSNSYAALCVGIQWIGTSLRQPGPRSFTQRTLIDAVRHYFALLPTIVLSRPYPRVSLAAFAEARHRAPSSPLDGCSALSVRLAVGKFVNSPPTTLPISSGSKRARIQNSAVAKKGCRLARRPDGIVSITALRNWGVRPRGASWCHYANKRLTHWFIDHRS